MLLKNFCPVSSVMIDERKSRFCAAFTFLLLILFFYTSSPWVALFLGVDFYLRGFGKGEFSPLAILAGKTAGLLQLDKKMINAGPKIFAARIGLVFSGLVFLFSILSLPLLAVITAVVFAVFAFLEASIGFCMACYVYPYVLKITNP